MSTVAERSTFDPSRLTGLPAPVARYFAFALSPGQRIIARARLRSRGTFATRPNAWAPFTADQEVRTEPPEFVWNARIAMIPLLSVRVRDRYADGENASYPTLCKGRFEVGGEEYYAIEEPTSLNTIELLPQLLRMGVRAVKIEGRQRSPAYVAQVTRVWREAIDSACEPGGRYSVKPAWMAALDGVAEGQQHTLGAYHRKWK
jgi:collagenase-like PrtC family protease